MQALQERSGEYWEVPYLPIDPSDIGREYEPVVRINSQSGKGGVAFVMDTFYGFKLPKGMHKEFADVIQKIAEQQGEVAPEQIMEEFKANYYPSARSRSTSESARSPIRRPRRRIYHAGEGYLHGSRHEKYFEGIGNGPIDAVQQRTGKAAWHQDPGVGLHRARADLRFRSAGGFLYSSDGCKSGRVTYGVGISSNITRSSIRGIFSAVNRLFD